MRTTACTAAALMVGALVVPGAAPASASDRYRIVVTEKVSMTNLDLGTEGLSVGKADLSVTGLFGGGTPEGSWVITGGTGKWAGARGDMPFKFLSADTCRLVFRFTT